MMKSPALLQIAILAFLLGMLASANDLVFYGAGDSCFPGYAHVYCSNWPGQKCCKSADPFCVRGALWNPNGWTHTVYLTNSTECVLADEPQNYDRCVTSSECCLIMPLEKNNDRCSMYWHFGEPSPDPNNPPHTPLSARDAECSDPDVLAYTSDDGTQRRISIPEGEFDQVVQMYTMRNFKALGRYATLEEDGGSQ